MIYNSFSVCSFHFIYLLILVDSVELAALGSMADGEIGANLDHPLEEAHHLQRARAAPLQLRWLLRGRAGIAAATASPAVAAAVAITRGAAAASCHVRALLPRHDVHLLPRPAHL